MHDLLYVEDELEVRKNYVEYLKRFFQNVYEASNAQEALKVYEKHRPSILIIDINLPGESGVEFLQKIRKKDHATKAIMLTAQSDVDTLVSASELKLTKYLLKPISRQELKDAISLAMQEIQEFTTLPKKIIQLKEYYFWDQENKKLLREDQEHHLTKKEIELLSFLFSNINKTFSSDEIIYELWYDSYEPKEAALKTLIKGLRKKLPEGTIKNVFGVGYKIEVS